MKKSVAFIVLLLSVIITAPCIRTGAVLLVPQESTFEYPRERTVKKAVDREWKLRLVNPWNKLPEGYSVELGIFRGFYIDKRILPNVEAMFEDAKKAGINLKIDSVYRSHEDQTYAYNKKVNEYLSYGYGRKDAENKAATITARPDTSEHQTGLAIDIISEEYAKNHARMTAAFADTKAYEWLSTHCYDYGYILRYKENKTDVTGVIFEPWHYRFVGVEYAAQIRNFDGVFEEWLSEFNEKQSECPKDSAFLAVLCVQ